MTYKARIFTREELRKAFERVTDVYELSRHSYHSKPTSTTP